MKAIIPVLILFGMVSLLGACATSPSQTSAQITRAVSQPSATVSDTGDSTIEASASPVIPTSSPRPTASVQPTQTALPATSASSPTASASDDLIIADHTVVDQFNQIPDEYIQKASQLHLLFRHASVGWNISEALDCMAQNYSGSRPNFCDRGLSAGQIIANPKYDRSNWIFEFHAPPPGQNPGWWNKVQFFLDRVNNLGPNEHFDVVTFKLGYVDADNGSNLDDIFFHNDPNDNFPSIDGLLAIEAAHPDLKLMYMTLALAKSIGSPDSASFDQQMRDFASANHKILFDIADIESHSPDGAPCFDNHGGGIEALCDEYTQEKNAGHLNALGSQRVAKALWWMMARLAGWDGTTS